MDSARRNPPFGTGWDSRYGAGRVDAQEAVRRASGAAVGPIATMSRARLGLPRREAIAASASSELAAALAGLVADGRMKMRLQIELEPME